MVLPERVLLRHVRGECSQALGPAPWVPVLTTHTHAQRDGTTYFEVRTYPGPHAPCDRRELSTECPAMWPDRASMRPSRRTPTTSSARLRTDGCCGRRWRVRLLPLLPPSGPWPRAFCPSPSLRAEAGGWAARGAAETLSDDRPARGVRPTRFFRRGCVHDGPRAQQRHRFRGFVRAAPPGKPWLILPGLTRCGC